MATAEQERDDHIKQLVDASPPLTPEQRNKLALLLLRPADGTTGHQGH